MVARRAGDMFLHRVVFNVLSATDSRANKVQDLCLGTLQVPGHPDRARSRDLPIWDEYLR